MEQMTDQFGQNPQASQPAPQTHFSGGGAGHEPTLATKVLVVGLVLISIAVIMTLALPVFRKGTSYESVLNNDGYQVVALTNGQVYFGRLSDANDNYLRLTDVFYLQVQQPVQTSAEGQASQLQFNLIKLGDEIHGPEDNIFLSREQVVFWNNLKEDGRLVTEIRKYKETQSEEQTEQPAQ